MPKLDFGTRVLYDRNPDSTNIKQTKWAKGMIKDRENPRKYKILTDDSDRMTTRSRHHIKAYMTKSGGSVRPQNI